MLSAISLLCGLQASVVIAANLPNDNDIGAFVPPRIPSHVGRGSDWVSRPWRSNHQARSWLKVGPIGRDSRTVYPRLPRLLSPLCFPYY